MLVRKSARDVDALDAAFAAGAALGALDGLVRQDAAFAGAWRGRLALKAALASLADRPVDETALRDTLALTKPAHDPGPAGRVHAAWRSLAAGLERKLSDIAAAYGEDPAKLAAIVKVYAGSAAPAPLAAAAAVAAMTPAGADAGAPAFALADVVLAARLGWPRPPPLLAAQFPARSIAARPGDPGWVAACCAAYARAAALACDLHADLGLAAARLQAVAPKLRAKGAGAAISALLDDDVAWGAQTIPGLSDRGLRRLFDRLVALGAVRELTGRATFRLYGL